MCQRAQVRGTAYDQAVRHHHTKNTGDLGAISAMADMSKKGWRILVPFTEHEAFDFVAYDGMRFVRVQAKYRQMKRGCAYVEFRSSWSDRNGVHHAPVDRDSIDLICVYVPESDSCYYFDPAVVQAKSITLRIEPTRNNNEKRITWARDFVDIPATVRGFSAGEGNGLVGWGWMRQSPPPRAA
jgi:hypothetical protein